MPRDVTLEEAQRDWTTTVIDIGETAATVGAGAAAIYRMTDGKKLSRAIRRTSAKFAYTKRLLESKSYDDWNKKTIKNAYREAKKQFGDIDRDTVIAPIQVNALHPRSLLSQIGKAFTNNFEGDSGRIARSENFDRIRANAVRRAQEMMRNIRQDKLIERDLQEAKIFTESFVNAYQYNRSTKQYEMAGFDVATALQKLREKEQAGKGPEKERMSHAEANQFSADLQAFIEAELSNHVNFKPSDSQKIEKKMFDFLMDIERLENRKQQQQTWGKKVIDNALGDQQATLGHLLDYYENHQDKIVGLTREYRDKDGSKKSFNVLEELNKFLQNVSDEDRERFRKLKVDPYLRTDDKGNIYSFDELANIKDKALEVAAGTIPGKILKLRDIHMSTKIPTVFRLAEGQWNPLLASLGNDLNNPNANKEFLDDNYWYIDGQVFKQSLDTGDFTEIEDLSNNVDVLSGRLGLATRLLRSITGANAQRYYEEGSWHNYFDIGTSTETWLPKKIQLFFKKERDDGRVNTPLARLQRFRFNPIEDMYTDDIQTVKGYRTIKKMMDFMENNVFQFDNEVISKLSARNDNSQIEQQLLSWLSTDSYTYNNTKLIESVAQRRIGQNAYQFRNQGLNELLDLYLRDEELVSEKLKLKRDQSGAYYNGMSVAQGIDEMLRTELSKEYVLQRIDNANAQTNDAYALIQNLIETSGISATSARKAKELAYFTILDESSQVFHNKTTGISDIDLVREGIRRFESLMAGTPNQGQEDAQHILENIFHNQSSPLDIENIKLDTDTLPEMMPSNIIVRKGVGPIDLIKGINQTISASGAERDKGIETVERFFKQWTAGRDNLEDLTTYTMIPYFFVHRLGEGLGSFGLGFSNISTGSTMDMVKTIMLKRILPAAVIGTYEDWFDDTTQGITGTGANAFVVNSFANVDLGIRRTIDAIGLNSAFDGLADFAPFQYWFDGNTFNTYEEQQDYYQNGYEAVRAGRYWAFGSANEFRGGEIEYFRPNLTRRLNSDYYDKSMYSGYWDKWAHSLLPTPAMPISPLIYALDPYYLENEHKEDRPYPISAPMFSENTPWGIVLNPTIGEFIKPKVRMNEDRMYGGTDIMALITDMNNRIRRTAMSRDNENIIVLDNARMGPYKYYDYDHPTPTETVVTPYNINRLRTASPTGEYDPLLSFGRMPEGIPMAQYGESIENAQATYGGSGLGFLSSSGINPSIIGGYESSKPYYERSLMDYIISPIDSFSSIGREIINRLKDNDITPRYGGRSAYNDTINIIANANKDIYKKAMAGDNGILINDKLTFNLSQIHDTIEKEDEIRDLIQSGSGYDLVKQTATSLRVIAGIYGYGANKLFGFGETEPHIANAGNMDSFSRSFWDLSVGGIGGEANEIARRFIPEYRRRNEINPLLNNMPDWLPERFRTGDAFAAIPYGEARLPGQGYESLNQLHSDRYGRYGSFDRFKILADIAPFSEEFKVWKKIARNENRGNTELLMEMEKIQERVDEQSKQHDFYDYRFIGRNADYKKAFITKVMDNGEFMVYGSSQIHKLAGVDFSAYAKDTKEILEQFVQPGTEVTIAVDSNPYHQTDSQNRVTAALFVDGESVSQALYDERLVKKRKGTNNAADVAAMHDGSGQILGAGLELASHLQIPLLSSRWLNVMSPLETYKSEQVMGDNYQTWDDVLGTTFLPSFYKSIASPGRALIENAAFLYLNSRHEETLNMWNKGGLFKAAMISGAMSAVNRGAFMGGAFAYFLTPEKGAWFSRGQKFGAAVELVGNLYSSTQNDSWLGLIGNWGFAGALVGDLLDEGKDIKPQLKQEADTALETLKNAGIPEESIEYKVQQAENLTKKIWRSDSSAIFRGKYIAGAVAAGVALKGVFGPGFASEDDHWISETTKKKWEIEDYFDRLTYMKYMGLYEKAAQLAYEKEGVSVKKIAAQVDAAADEAEFLKKDIYNRMLKAQSHNLANENENRIIVDEQKRIDSIRSTQLIMKAGEYTKAALLYKQAAESTMYGLRDSATWQDIVKALPRYERDYFIEFMKEKDPDAQQDILREASPFLRRALKQAWHMNYANDKGETNEEYFQHNNLPGIFSGVWNPNVDLNDVKAKVIKNEAMNAADFGIYESQYRESSTISAPNIARQGRQDYITMKLQMEAILNGMGLTGVDVTVEPSSTSGIQSVINIAKVTEYNLENILTGIL